MKSEKFMTESDKRGPLLDFSKARKPLPGIYRKIWSDLVLLQKGLPDFSPALHLETSEELLARDKKRVEEYKLQSRIRTVRRVLPSGEVLTILVTDEHGAKLRHGEFEPGSGGDTGGSVGDAEEGDEIGEQPLEGEGEGEGEGEAGGEGGGTEHEIDQETRDFSEKLIEEMELPNLQDKNKRIPTKKYKLDLTSCNKGSGQFLDKKRTLRQIVKTNLALGRLNSKKIDTGKMIIQPKDKIYRVLSPEREYQSAAVVFFLRDYSGSMHGVRTEFVVLQHIIIYTCLMKQYGKELVVPRFILHDTEAKEVPDLYTYYRSRVAGGTLIHTSFGLVREIIKEENLAENYNIYVFYGGDGDDFDTDGVRCIPEMVGLLELPINRMGITIASTSWSGGSIPQSEMQKYIEKTDLIKDMSSLFKMIVVDAQKGIEDEKTLKRSIKHMLS